MEPEGGFGGAGDEGGRVGADAEEGDVAEVEQAGEADDDVEAQGDGREDQDVGPDDRVLVGVLGQGEAGGGDEGRAEGHAAVGVGECGEPRDESGPVEGGDGQHHEDQVADEGGAVIGVDPVGEDQEPGGEGGRDDQDLGPGGEFEGAPP